MSSFGLGWDRNEFLASRRRLVGRNAVRNNLFADFREQNGVYALFGDDGSLKYVGIATHESLSDRLGRHLSDDYGEVWKAFSWFGFRVVLSDVAVNGWCGLVPRQIENDLSGLKAKHAIKDLEALLIYIQSDLLNRRQPRFRSADQWDQVAAAEVKRLRKMPATDSFLVGDHVSTTFGPGTIVRPHGGHQFKVKTEDGRTRLIRVALMAKRPDPTAETETHLK